MFKQIFKSMFWTINLYLLVRLIRRLSELEQTAESFCTRVEQYEDLAKLQEIALKLYYDGISFVKSIAEPVARNKEAEEIVRQEALRILDRCDKFLVSYEIGDMTGVLHQIENPDIDIKNKLRGFSNS